MFDYKNLLDTLFEKVERMRTERPSAGTRYWLMGMVADIMEVAETLQKEVLERVRQEAVLDADVDADFDVMAEKILSFERTKKNWIFLWFFAHLFVSLQVQSENDRFAE